MSELLTGADFDALFTSFDRTAVRLEARDQYQIHGEQEPFRRWLAGEPDDLAWFRPWLDMVAGRTARGLSFERVRVVPEPLTDYLRWELWGCQFNVEAGEQISYLPREQADELGLPRLDYWLFDNERVALLHFADNDELLGAEIITDESELERYRSWWTVAHGAARPYPDYVKSQPLSRTEKRE